MIMQRFSPAIPLEDNYNFDGISPSGDVLRVNSASTFTLYPLTRPQLANAAHLCVDDAYSLSFWLR